MLEGATYPTTRPYDCMFLSFNFSSFISCCFTNKFLTLPNSIIHTIQCRMSISFIISIIPCCKTFLKNKIENNQITSRLIEILFLSSHILYMIEVQRVLQHAPMIACFSFLTSIYFILFGLLTNFLSYFIQFFIYYNSE